MQIKVAQGKENNDRFTMLPAFIPEDLATFFRQNQNTIEMSCQFYFT
ncbi:hypothetical protein [Chryseolinea sp. H1M3-3]|nr:hypothetical protein [Chryseolinea sp. H1M3-3]